MDQTWSSCTSSTPSIRRSVARMARNFRRPIARDVAAQRVTQYMAGSMPSMERPAPGTTRRVLVVDDDQDFRRAVASVLQTEGWAVLEADNGLAALTAARSEPLSVIFLDCRLPGRSGQEVYRELRASGIATPVVLVTARPDVQDAAAALGVPDYLGKPFGIEDLVTVLERAARN